MKIQIKNRKLNSLVPLHCYNYQLSRSNSYWIIKLIEKLLTSINLNFRKWFDWWFSLNHETVCINELLRLEVCLTFKIYIWQNTNREKVNNNFTVHLWKHILFVEISVFAFEQNYIISSALLWSKLQFLAEM